VSLSSFGLVLGWWIYNNGFVVEKETRQEERRRTTVEERSSNIYGEGRGVVNSNDYRGVTTVVNGQYIHLLLREAVTVRNAMYIG
jgi:hypothetical protein